MTLVLSWKFLIHISPMSSLARKQFSFYQTNVETKPTRYFLMFYFGFF
jgi:hypothetical protein